jgi:hypothetical protein
MGENGLKVLVEATIRELYVQQAKQPVPAKFDNATPSDLLRLFQSIPRTLLWEYQSLSDK